MFTRCTFAVAAAALALPAGASAHHHPQGAPAVAYSTYFGGSSEEGCVDAPGADGNLYVACGTSSPDLPRVGGFQSYQGRDDGYVAKLDRSGRRIVWSTYLGSPGLEDIHGIAVDARGHVFVTGFAGAGFPTTRGAWDPTFNGTGDCCGEAPGDAFVAELSPDGSRLIYSTYLGGSGMTARTRSRWRTTAVSSSPASPARRTSRSRAGRWTRPSAAGRGTSRACRWTRSPPS